MGWWELENEIKMGDGILDIAEQFLEDITKEYIDDIGRKPKLIEVLRSIELILKYRAEEYIQEGDLHDIGSISGKMKRRRKKQSINVGDVFAIPLEDKVFAYAIITPQYLYVELFRYKSNKIANVECLRNVERIRLPYLFDIDPILRRQWKIVGHLPYDRNIFVPQQFLIARQVTCGKDVINGFINVSTELCNASETELSTLPKASIANEAYIVIDIEKRLSDV